MFGSVINDVLVNLVGDGQDIPFLAETPDELQFLATEDLARRVIRCIDNNGLRLVIERRRKFFLVKRPAGSSQLNVAWSGSRNDRVGTVILIERFENDDFVTRINNRQQHINHGFRRTARDGDLALGIDVDAHEFFRLINQRVAEILGAPGDRILIDIGEYRVRSRLLEYVGSRKIGKSLREIDGVMLQGKTSHLANHRFSELGCLV